MASQTPPALDSALTGPGASLGLLGRGVLASVGEAGRATLFIVGAAALLPRVLRRPRLLLEQLYFIGNRSVVVVTLTAAFTGMVLTLQGYNALARFGAEQMVGALVALSLCRELGPVLGGLMVTARAGSAIAATIGNMRVSEQIDALETMAISPREYLVVPRLVAALLLGPLLTALFDVVGIGAAYLFADTALGLPGASFISSARDAVDGADIAAGVYKSVVFSLVMVWVSTYRGYTTSGGAKGVGQATTRAVVETSVLILALDYVLTALLF